MKIKKMCSKISLFVAMLLCFTNLFLIFSETAYASEDRSYPHSISLSLSRSGNRVNYTVRISVTEVINYDGPNGGAFFDAEGEADVTLSYNGETISLGSFTYDAARGSCTVFTKSGSFSCSGGVTVTARFEYLWGGDQWNDWTGFNSSATKTLGADSSGGGSSGGGSGGSSGGGSSGGTTEFRASVGIKFVPTSASTGKVVYSCRVEDEDTLMFYYWLKQKKPYNDTLKKVDDDLLFSYYDDYHEDSYDVTTNESGRVYYVDYQFLHGSTHGLHKCSNDLTIPASYSLSYNLNGGSGSIPDSKKVWSNYSVSVSSVSPTRNGYIFTGWNTSANGSGTSYKAGDNISLSKNITLYAQWKLSTAPVTCIDILGSNPYGKELSRQTVTKTIGTTIRGSSFNTKFSNPLTSDAAYCIKKGYKYTGDSGQITVSAGSNIVYRYFEKAPTTYTVNHWLQNIGSNPNAYNSSNYTLKDSEKNLSAVTGSTVTGVIRSYVGFTSPSKAPTAICNADGSTVINIYYTRNKYSIGQKDSNGKLHLINGLGIQSTSGAGSYYYEQSVTINAVVKPGYKWTNWTDFNNNFSLVTNTRAYTFKMPAHDLIYRANAVPRDDTKFVVNHWKQNVRSDVDSLNSSNYTLADTDYYMGTTDTSVTPPLKTYIGFTAYAGVSTANDEAVKKADSSGIPMTVNINGDGTRVINYYYSRNEYSVGVPDPSVNPDDGSNPPLILNCGTGIESTSGAGVYQFEEKVNINAVVKPGYTWSEWIDNSSVPTLTNGKESEKSYTFSMPANDVMFTATATPNNNTAYTVNHWKQNVNTDSQTYDKDDYVNGYTLADTDHLKGTTDTSATPPLRTYTGFTAYTGNTLANNEEESVATTSIPMTVNINGDGSRVINYYYTRNTYTVGIPDAGSNSGSDIKFILNCGTGIESTSGGGIYQYEQSVSIDAVVKPGYTWVNWTDDNDNKQQVAMTQQFKFNMPAKDVVYTANARPNKYTVIYVQNKPAEETDNEVYGTMRDTECTYDLHGIVASTCRYTLKGWDFVEWNTEPDGSGTSYKEGDELYNLTTVDNDTIPLYAIWIKQIKWTGKLSTRSSREKNIYEIARESTAEELAETNSWNNGRLFRTNILSKLQQDLDSEALTLKEFSAMTGKLDITWDKEYFKEISYDFSIPVDIKLDEGPYIVSSGNNYTVTFNEDDYPADADREYTIYFVVPYEEESDVIEDKEYLAYCDITVKYHTKTSETRRVYFNTEELDLSHIRSRIRYQPGQKD